MDEVLISVIVPAYNIEKHIGRCLDSILNQEHKALEVIVVDDGSTDRTKDIIDEYAIKDRRIIPLHKENGGVSKARLTGIKMAKGMFIGFVDGDDYVEPSMYKHLLGNAICYNAQISHCGYKMVFPDGHEDLYYGTKEVVEQTYKDGLIDLLCGRRIEPSLCNKLFHRSVIEEFDMSPLWDENIRTNEDLLMNYLFFKKANNSIYEDIPFYHYILRKGSAATSKNKHYKISDPLKVMKLIKDDTKDDVDLYEVIYERYIRTLIGVAMQNDWQNDAIEAKKSLKLEYRSKDFRNLCKTKKIGVMVFGVIYLQKIYRIIRILYERITGISKKFEI